MLRVDIAKQLGEFSLSASFESEGRVTGLFGASGAGKTSLINVIAGLLTPDRGSIAVDGETLDDTAAGVHVPPHRRRIGYVFQDARLFPLVLQGCKNVACLLCHPGAVGMGGDAGDVHAPALELDEEEDVQAAQAEGVDGEEVALDDAGCLLA